MSDPVELSLPSTWAGEEDVRLRWLVPDGAQVRRGQAVCELEAAKATVEIVSPTAGTLRHDLPAGTIAAAGRVGRILVDASIPPPAPAPPSARPAEAASMGPRVTPRTLRKDTEIGTLEEARRGGLPSTVMQQVALGGLPDRLRDEGATLTALVVHEVARALHRHPALNASYVEAGTLVHGEVRLGVALDVEPHGLKVAVIPEADTRSVAEIAGDLQVLLYRYLTKTLEPAATRGATFTITDLSSFDVSWTVPLLVDHQSAILGLGLGGGRQEPTLMLSLTFDHRVASGREAALFLRDLRSRITAHVANVPRPAARCALCERTLAELPAGKAYLLRATVADGRTVDACPTCLATGSA